eukprot:tig00021238_g19560.t1
MHGFLAPVPAFRLRPNTLSVVPSVGTAPARPAAKKTAHLSSSFVQKRFLGSTTSQGRIMGRPARTIAELPDDAPVTAEPATRTAEPELVVAEQRAFLLERQAAVLPDVVEMKKELRKRFRASLKAMTPQELEADSRAVCEAVLRSDAYRRAKHVGVYVPLPSELSTYVVLQDLLRPGSGKYAYVPRTNMADCSMELLRIDSLSEVASGDEHEYALSEPAETREDGSPRVNAFEEGLDLILVPGLGFDRRGGRIGRGKGFYDRYLERCEAAAAKLGKPRPFTMGLALGVQEVDRVPMDKHDRRLDQVVFPR